MLMQHVYRPNLHICTSPIIPMFSLRYVLIKPYLRRIFPMSACVMFIIFLITKIPVFDNKS